jgi:hypothetical protein
VSGLRACRIDQAKARDFVRRHHRHHDPDQGWRFGLGAWTGERGLAGVIVVGRPRTNSIDQERVVEVTRCCTDGTRNACSFLYARAAEAAAALGFDAIITYTLDAEAGASLRALGWWGETAATPGKSWSHARRLREARRGTDLGSKTRWLKILGDFSAPPQVGVPIASAQIPMAL